MLGVTFTELHTQRDRLLAIREVEQLDSAVQRRVQGEPIAYILGSTSFRNLTIKVSPEVLIPRPETELLVDTVRQLTPSTGRVLDLGTGSGAIAISLTKEHSVQVVAVDIDPRALQILAKNCALQEVSIEMVQSDWYSNVTGHFDTIVANPPYIAGHDPHVDRGDLRYEPRLALVSGPTGLEHFNEIVGSAPRYLRPSGWLVVEHGHDQRDAVIRLFNKHGFSRVQHRKDYSDTPRIVWGQWDGR